MDDFPHPWLADYRDACFPCLVDTRRLAFDCLHCPVVMQDDWLWMAAKVDSWVDWAVDLQNHFDSLRHRCKSAHHRCKSGRHRRLRRYIHHGLRLRLRRRHAHHRRDRHVEQLPCW